MIPGDSGPGPCSPYQFYRNLLYSASGTRRVASIHSLTAGQSNNTVVWLNFLTGLCVSAEPARVGRSSNPWIASRAFRAGRWRSGRSIGTNAFGWPNKSATFASMTAPTLIAAFLDARRPAAYCADCLARDLNLASRLDAQYAMRALAKSSAYTRMIGQCSQCGATNTLVIRSNRI